jgi:Cytochrome c oxidase caa3 assembly factor (Caa3_CtaG)
MSGPGRQGRGPRSTDTAVRIRPFPDGYLRLCMMHHIAVAIWCIMCTVCRVSGTAHDQTDPSGGFRGADRPRARPALAAAEMITLLAAGTGIWREVTSQRPGPRQLPRPARAALATAAMWTIWVLAYLTGMSGVSWLAAYHRGGAGGLSAAADQQVTAAILWAVPALCFLPAVYVTVMAWLSGPAGSGRPAGSGGTPPAAPGHREAGAHRAPGYPAASARPGTGRPRASHNVLDPAADQPPVHRVRGDQPGEHADMQEEPERGGAGGQVRGGKQHQLRDAPPPKAPAVLTCRVQLVGR